jgi:hypothetical protein
MLVRRDRAELVTVASRKIAKSKMVCLSHDASSCGVSESFHHSGLREKCLRLDDGVAIAAAFVADRMPGGTVSLLGFLHACKARQDSLVK